MKMLEGVFISLTEKESAELWEVVKSHGFEENGEGVKALLFELLEGPEEENEPEAFSEKVANFINENPEKLAEYVQGGKVLFSILKNAITKKPG